MATMKAIQIKKFNAPYEVSDVPIPRPEPHQVLVKIKAGGLCHTDLMILDHEFSGVELPVIGSHEPAGVVEAVGSAVTDFAVGDRVGCLNFESVCGKCPDCEADRPIYCDSPTMKGILVDGAWAEYMVANARFVVKLPEAISFPVAACLMCAGVTIYGGIKTANVPKGGSIAIVGIGGLGHIGTQVAKALGYQVVAVDVKQSALDLVSSYDYKPDVCLLGKEDAQTARDKISAVVKTPYPGVDATILATDAPASFKFGAAITKKHGTMVLLGQPSEGITMPYNDLIFRDIKLVGSLLADTKKAEEIVQLVAQHNINVKIKEWKIEDAEAMRQEYLTGKPDGKNVIVF